MGQLYNGLEIPVKMARFAKKTCGIGKVFIPSMKPSQELEKCPRWIDACSSKFFTEKKILRKTYMCAIHWPGEH